MKTFVEMTWNDPLANAIFVDTTLCNKDETVFTG